MRNRKVLAIVLAMLMVLACINVVAFAQAIEVVSPELVVSVE